MPNDAIEIGSPGNDPQSTAARVLDQDAGAAPALRGEPAAIIAALVVVLAAVQELALPLPHWANTTITLVLIAAGALGIRQRVTPIYS